MCALGGTPPATFHSPSPIRPHLACLPSPPHATAVHAHRRHVPELQQLAHLRPGVLQPGKQLPRSFARPPGSRRVRSCCCSRALMRPATGEATVLRAGQERRICDAGGLRCSRDAHSLAGNTASACLPPPPPLQGPFATPAALMAAFNAGKIKKCTTPYGKPGYDDTVGPRCACFGGLRVVHECCAGLLVWWAGRGRQSPESARAPSGDEGGGGAAGTRRKRCCAGGLLSWWSASACTPAQVHRSLTCPPPLPSPSLPSRSGLAPTLPAAPVCASPPPLQAPVPSGLKGSALV